VILPAFQAQNPAISGYSLGWSSCTAFSGAMAAAFDSQVQKVMTGGQLRTMTHDTSGGLTLQQIDAALLEGWDINLNTVYGYPWADFVRRIDAGQGAILQGWYAPIADSAFDAGRGFRGNHAIFVPPGWGAMDPLADGRAAGVYKYHGQAYPQSLLGTFAGKLNLGGSTYRALGAGLAYASFTADRVASYVVSMPAAKYGVYTVGGRTIVGVRTARTGGFRARSTSPLLYAWPGHTSQSLVRLLTGSHGDAALGAGKGQYVRASHAQEVWP